MHAGMNDIPALQYPELHKRLLADVYAAHAACLAATIPGICEARQQKEGALARLFAFDRGELTP
jgi:hypothetical protein